MDPEESEQARAAFWELVGESVTRYVDNHKNRHAHYWSLSREELLAKLEDAIQAETDWEWGWWFYGDWINCSRHHDAAQHVVRDIARVISGDDVIGDDEEVAVVTELRQRVREDYAKDFKGIEAVAWKVFTETATPEERQAWEGSREFRDMQEALDWDPGKVWDPEQGRWIDSEDPERKPADPNQLSLFSDDV